MRDIVLIAHDIRSTHNVGSLLRTADGLGVSHVYMTGYTPYPAAHSDQRLPHIVQKLSKQINKTALGAERTVPWSHHENIDELLQALSADGYQLIALEQAADATPLKSLRVSDKCALLLGREVEGIEPRLLKSVDVITEISMYGHKESFNVAQAAAIALYVLRES